MIAKDQFIASLRDETRIAIHLCGRLAPAAGTWRPTPGQRSTLELLRYLTTCAIAPATYAVTGSWQHRPAMEAAAARLPLADIPAALAAQAEALAALLAPLSEEDLRTRPAKLPWEAVTTLGDALVTTALKPLVAYRMQLFLYAKASGSPQLSTWDCWVGIDAPAAAG